MKKLALFTVLAAASNSFASFDLGLVLQTYDDPNGPQQSIITRWDPVNRMELGRFATPGFTSSTKLMLNPSAPGVLTGATITSGSVRLNSYAYSTGNYLGQTSFSISANFLSSADMISSNTVLLTGANIGSPFARLFSTNGAIIRSYVLPTGTLSVLDAHLGADGIVHVLSRQNGTSSNNKYTLTSHAANSSAIAESVVVLDNSLTPVTNFVRQGNAIAVNAGDLGTRRLVTLNGTSLSTTGTIVGGWVVPTTKLVAGHGNMIHGFGYDSNQTRTYVSSAIIDSSFGNTFFYNSNTAYGNLYDAVVVVAPEPGTLLALGAGAAALLRRRNKK